MAYLIESGCSGCGMCVEACPRECISDESMPARIDAEECVDCGPGASEAPELRRSSCRCFADLGIDDAGLEESIRVGVAPPVTLQRLDEHHRGDDRCGEDYAGQSHTAIL